MSNSSDTIPLPHSAEIEQEILGGLLNGNILPGEIFPSVSEDYFYLPRHQALFKVLGRMFGEQTPFSFALLVVRLRERKLLETVGDQEYLIELQDACVSSAATKSNLRKLHEMFLRRQAIALASEIDNKARNESVGDGSIFLAEPVARLQEIVNQAATDSIGKSIKAHLVSLDEVQSETVEFVWPRRIPKGKLTIFDGDPGLGKTLITTDLAARISTGREMPDGSTPIQGGVVLLNVEDGLGDTIRPRLEAAGADLKAIVALTGIPESQGERLPSIPRDLDAIEAAIEKVHAVLVVVDPLMAFLGGDVNSHIDHDVRRALAPLSVLAEKTGAAFLVVRHLNKMSGGNPLHRGGGSIALIGAARAGYVVAKDPENETERVLATTKFNLGPEPTSLRYRVVEAENGVARIEWLGLSPHRADILLAQPRTEEEKSEIQNAKDFLLQLLGNGPILASEVCQQARQAGIAERTLHRAKAVCGVKSSREGFGPGSKVSWYLPSEQSRVQTPVEPHIDGQNSHTSPPKSLAAYGDSWQPMGKSDSTGKTCVACGQARFWVSTTDVTVCETCHPPASEDIVKSRITGEVRP